MIDIDTAASGEQRSGTYFALWSLVTKLSLALTVIAILPLLEWYGFSASATPPSTAVGISLLGYVYGWGPIIMKLPAVALMWHFPLDRKQVDSLRQSIGTDQLKT